MTSLTDIKFEDGERKRGITESQIEGDGDDDRDSDRDSRSSTKQRREGDRVKAKVTGWTKYYGGRGRTIVKKVIKFRLVLIQR